MWNLGKKQSVYKRFLKNEDGNLALTFAVSLTLIATAVGTAIDYSQLITAKSKSQTIADTIALTSAIYIKNNDRPPKNNNDGYVDGVAYKAADIGYDFKGAVQEGATVTVDYDDNAKTATVTVRGATTPTFTQILGKDRLPFTSISVVSYLEVEDSFPASIALVLDNSGSMQFDDKLALNPRDVTISYSCTQTVRRKVPVQYRGKTYLVWRWVEETTTCTREERRGDQAPGAQVRLDGLKSSVIQFQRDLKSRIGTKSPSSRQTVRTGMLPYSGNTLDEIPMEWGYINEGFADSKPNDGEKNGSGINGMEAFGGTNSSPPMTDARNWMMLEDKFHTEEAKRTNTVDEPPLKFVIFMTDGQNTSGNWTIEAGNTGQWHKISGNNTDTRSNYASGYTEGILIRAVDTETINSCAQMKQENVTIFTIGYALEDFGEFRVNGWNDNHDDSLKNVPSSVQTSAFNLLRSCASSPEHFIQAADANKLEEAFNEIQNAIVEELIRIKS